MVERCCNGVCFSELVECYREDGYLKAHGWTTSTGQSDPWRYTVPSGWEFDPAFEDITGEVGSHGGCSSCIMTLVHLRKLSAEPEPSKIPWLMIGIVLIGLYLYLKR